MLDGWEIPKTWVLEVTVAEPALDSAMLRDASLLHMVLVIAWAWQAPLWLLASPAIAQGQAHVLIHRHLLETEEAEEVGIGVLQRASEMGSYRDPALEHSPMHQTLHHHWAL